MVSFIRKCLHLRPDLSVSFYVLDFVFRRVFRQNAKVKWPVHHTSVIHSPERLKVGKGVWPGDSPNVYINAYNGVRVGDYSNIGPGVVIASTNHDLVDNAQPTKDSPIDIGRFCWLGGNSVILPGVVLGDFTIVGAGAVVTKSFEEGYCVIGGNPAKLIKQLNKENCKAFAQTKV